MPESTITIERDQRDGLYEAPGTRWKYVHRYPRSIYGWLTCTSVERGRELRQRANSKRRTARGAVLLAGLLTLCGSMLEVSAVSASLTPGMSA
jgi:hypothetical protein